MTSRQDDDWQLLARVRGDPEALAELFRRHRDTVFRIAFARTRNSEDANEITQEVFLRLAGYRRPVFRRARFTTWLYRVTANLVADEWRRRGRRQEISLEAVVETGSESNAEFSADLARVLSVLGDLPRRQREAFELRILEQWSLGDDAAIANETRLGLETIGSGETVAGATRFADGAGRHGKFE